MGRSKILVIECVLAAAVHLTAAITTITEDIDNEILGEPAIICGSDTVEMRLLTRSPFKGNVFVKGQYADPQCRFNQSISGVHSNVTIALRHESCDIQRRRLISPRAMQLQSVIIVSFHPIFITGVDKAYSIKCLYREEERTVSAGLDVSALTTVTLTYTFPMPQCSYTIRKDKIDGEILHYARVGDQLVHRWECETDVFGILVHSCYVDDGQGQRVYVVDELGCHKDRYILGDPTYVEKLNMAYRESHVFKFADRLTVRFQCQIQLCVKFDDGCKGITPPICASAMESALPMFADNDTDTVNATAEGFQNATLEGGRDERAVRLRPKRSEHRLDPILEELYGDVVSQDIYVLEKLENPDLGSSDESVWSQSTLESVPSGKQLACLSVPAFITILTLITVAFLSTSLAWFHLLHKRRRQGEKEQKH